jgi:RNA polymerase sigma factor (sigma-70 family)
MKPKLINALFTKAQEGDQEAKEALFQELWESFFPIVEHEIWKEEDRPDVLQDLMEAMLEKLKTGENINSPYGYACGILNNLIKMYIKEKKRERETFVGLKGENQESGSKGPDPWYPLRKKRLIECLTKIFKKHPEYAPILERLMEEYTPREIAVELNMKASRIHTIIHRCRKWLQECTEKGRR